MELGDSIKPSRYMSPLLSVIRDSTHTAGGMNVLFGWFVSIMSIIMVKRGEHDDGS